MLITGHWTGGWHRSASAWFNGTRCGRSSTTLADRTFNSDQAFGALLNRLLAAGLIERQPGAGRALTHRLTPRGRTLLEDGQATMTEVTERSFGPLDEDERDQLARLLDKILISPEPS